MAELDFIKALAGHVPQATSPELLIGIGDDCAVVQKNDETSLLYTMDSLVAGVHFDLAFHPPSLLGRKSAAVNMSDIAGMGGVPKFALLSMGLPSSFGESSRQEFMTGFFSMCDECDVVLIGGDTVVDERLAITVTLIGEAETTDICTRSGARAGDEIWVSGDLGGSSVGLGLLQQGESADAFPELVQAHLDPRPQLALGQALAQSGLVSAMLDSSDGLATDLAHICSQSSCGAVIHRGLLPISAIMKEAAFVTGQDPLTQALSGGEDYGLVFTVKPGQGGELARVAHSVTGCTISHIGAMDDGCGVRLADGNTMKDISYQGYEHT